MQTSVISFGIWMPMALLSKSFSWQTSQRNEYSWTVLISQHAKSGQSRQALRMYDEMRKQGVEPSPRTFVSVLKACCRLQDLEGVKRIHAEVVSRGLESNLYVGTMLVDVYAKCRSLADARHAFDKLPCRDVVSWTAMILGYAQMDHGEEALQLYAQMQHDGVVPDGSTYVSALKACTAMAESAERNENDGVAVKERCLTTVRAIHMDIVKGKFETGVFVGTMLVDAYAKCGSLEDARLVFEKMPRRDAVCWNAMILGYAQDANGEEALQLYIRMRQEGVVPNEATYVSALKACSTMEELGEINDGGVTAVKGRYLETVRGIHTDIVKGKFEWSLFVGTMLVDVYAKCGSLEDARRVFEKIPHHDVVSWNAMIWGYAQMDKGEEALRLYTLMQQEGMAPNDRTYVGALKACSSMAESGDMTVGDGVAVKERCLETVRTIYSDVVKGKFESDLFVGTMLVDAFAKSGSLDDARCVFEKMCHRDVVSWTAMIIGCTQMGKAEEALQLYSRMQLEGVVPNEQTYVGALNACGSLAGLDKGKEIHLQILQAGQGAAGSFVTASLIAMYGKCGSMVDAQLVFDAMPTREIVAWNALIAGYAHQGESEQVFELLRRMKQASIQPNGITFVGVLTVCSHVGLLDRGQTYFKAMSTDYGITPTIKHFTCMVDLLGRSGHLDQAMEMVKATPFQLDSAVWACVLGACQKWGAIQLGWQALECAVSMDPDDPAPYTLMSNIYAAAHMHKEADEMQAMRVSSQAWKQPGQSRWTDTRGIAHMFCVGDRGLTDYQEIDAKLGNLVVKVKQEGYIPVFESDIPDDEKDPLSGLSEKLAIAYSLLKVPAAWTTTCVVRNQVLFEHSQAQVQCPSCPELRNGR